jgi:hypothetical protein
VTFADAIDGAAVDRGELSRERFGGRLAIAIGRVDELHRLDDDVLFPLLVLGDELPDFFGVSAWVHRINSYPSRGWQTTAQHASREDGATPAAARVFLANALGKNPSPGAPAALRISRPLCADLPSVGHGERDSWSLDGRRVARQ